ncbi:MAG: hypothetical protein DRP81_05340 [Candidatus Omnitrophota bacterium]|nr:MAG: hypothetical protein DRP81_05340 [Candidatus Omnitrophota bacterium]HDN86287.1 16S rRNA (uracil(1498)-N(3))-methyltransferase [Candidatus Omnitrophota bacterium]
MSRVRLYFPPQKIKEYVSIQEKEILHKIKEVLRLNEGRPLFIFDGQGREYLYTLTEIRKESVEIRKIKLVREEPKPTTRIILAFPLMREAKLDLIFQKCTELGIFKFLPFFAQRSIIRTPPSQAKLLRWRKIVEEAVRQSNQLWFPEVEEVRDFEAVIKEKADLKVAAHPKGDLLFEMFKGGRYSQILIIIGPEGDFSHQELEKLKEHNFLFFRLSPNILRSETSAIFSVGLINYLSLL